MINYLIKFNSKVNNFLDFIFCKLFSRKLKKVPNHVGIIPDGIRRYARKKAKLLIKKPPEEYLFKITYNYAAEKLEGVVKFLFEVGVKKVTVYCLSYDNFTKRPKYLVNHLLKLFETYLDKFGEEKVKIKVVGEIDLLPKNIQEKIKVVEEKSKKYENELKLLVVYDYRKIPGTGDPIDLLIRSGKERRTSGFLPLDIAYAELYFINKYWPEVGKRDIYKALQWYSKRERRFGK